MVRTVYVLYTHAAAGAVHLYVMEFYYQSYLKCFLRGFDLTVCDSGIYQFIYGSTAQLRPGRNMLQVRVDVLQDQLVQSCRVACCV
jgi:hypothetical protein